MKARHISDEAAILKAMASAPAAETRTAFDRVNPDKMPPPLVLGVRPKVKK